MHIFYYMFLNVNEKLLKLANKVDIEKALSFIINWDSGLEKESLKAVPKQFCIHSFKMYAFCDGALKKQGWLYQKKKRC